MSVNGIQIVPVDADNRALRFYQTRGFGMARLNRNMPEVSRRMKPSISQVGEYGIPLRHEIEFEKPL